MPATGSDGSVQDLRITRSSAVDQVAEAVREMILRGELAPGTRLREVQMAESIGISRNTARDAVRQKFSIALEIEVRIVGDAARAAA